MEINLTTVLLNEDGEPLVEARTVDKVTTKVELTLAIVTGRGLLAPADGDNDGKKVEKYELWLRILNKTEVELSAEDIVLIKKSVGRIYGPLIIGQTYRLLEGKDSGIEKENQI